MAKKKSKAFPKAGQLGKNTIPVGALLGGTADIIGSTILNLGGGGAVSLMSGGNPDILGWDAKRRTYKGAAWENLGKSVERFKKATSPETYGSQSTGGDINFSLQTGDWLKTSDKIRKLKKRITSANNVTLGIQ